MTDLTVESMQTRIPANNPEVVGSNPGFATLEEAPKMVPLLITGEIGIQTWDPLAMSRTRGASRLIVPIPFLHPADVLIILAAMKAKVDYLVTHNRARFFGDPGVAVKANLRIGSLGNALNWCGDTYSPKNDKGSHRGFEPRPHRRP
jgi:hypothetical protein